MSVAIYSIDSFHKIINADEPCIIYFRTSWSGPCRIIAPIYDKLSGDFPQVKFYKVDIDDQQDITQECGVQAVPAFQVYHKGNKVGEIKGAAPQELQELLVQASSLV